jgi:hypothetical protein
MDSVMLCGQAPEDRKKARYNVLQDQKPHFGPRNSLKAIEAFKIEIGSKVKRGQESCWINPSDNKL